MVDNSYDAARPRPFDPTQLGEDNPSIQDTSYDINTGLNLDNWAEKRLSIYASLDAAMTRHLVEAVTALNEFKQQAENNAYEQTRSLMLHRDELRREIEDLRAQKERARMDLDEARREADGERARKMAIEREAELLMVESQVERESVKREIATLQSQFAQLSLQLQTFFEQRMSDLWASASSTRPPTTNTPLPNPPSRLPATDLPTAHDQKPTTEQSDALKQAKQMLSLGLEEFSDAPTPRLTTNGNGKHHPPEYTAAKPPEPTTPAPIEEDESLPQPFIFQNEPVKDSDNEAVKGTSKRPLSSTTEQRVQHLLNRRKNGNSEAVDAGEPSTNGNGNGNGNGRGKRKRPDSDKAALEELGAKLGLDANTPPPETSLRFAPGYTPPPSTNSLAAALAEIFDNPAETPPPNGISDLETPPRIGDIGTDNAIRWSDNEIKRPGLDAPNLPRRTPGGIFPAFPLQPPPSNMRSLQEEGEGAADIETKITVSNLQGLSLLMMEKVVRGLPGVRHVTVTDFRKGELVMEVRHQAALELESVLPSLPDLNLKLVNKSETGLEFMQDR